MKRVIPLILLLAFVAVAPAARADLTIEMKHNGEPQVVCITAHAFQTSLKDGMMIFRGDKRLLWMVDPKDKKYSELTEEDAKAMGEKLNDAMAQMQEALKNAPPAQRAMMEKMMKGQMGAMTPKERTVKATGEKKEINGFDCAGYLVSMSDGQTTDVWAAAPKELKIDATDLTVLKDLGEFMKAMLPGTDQFADLIKDYDNPGKDQVPGFPVLTIHKDASGKEQWRSELVKVDKAPIAADKFEIPAGFKKEKVKFDE